MGNGQWAEALRSRIGYGGMHLSIDGRPGEAQSLSVLHAVLDAGVRLIDTADVYCLDHTEIGHNERLIAKALATWRGDRASVLVATKGGLIRPQGRWVSKADPRHLKAACEASLRALGVERIGLYQLHAPDPAVPFPESVGALADLKKEGKIEHAGLSNVSVEEIDEAGRIVPIASVQNRLNPFFREALRGGVVRHCDDHGLAFLAYSPVGGGRLNRKLPSHPALLPIARRHGASPHAVVLAWVRAQGRSVIPIPSARTVEHALDSFGSTSLELAAEDLAAIDRAEFEIR